MIIERRYLGLEKPLKKVLPELFPEITYSELQACLRRRDVKSDGVRVSDSFVVPQGALLAIYPKSKKSLRILYEDDEVLACYKPKGIASDGEHSFSEIVRAERDSARLMHRLDTNTDGLLLFAKSDRAYDSLYDAMKDGLITKEYTAEVYGHPPVGEEIALDYYYKKDSEKGRALLTDTPIKGYVPVHIAFRVIEVKAESAVLSVVLHKGKMHQIRAMLARYGYFILGDGKYGSDEINRRLGISKTLLTASAITFSFPQDSPFSYLNRIRISL